MSSAVHRHGAVYSTWLEGERGVTVYLPPGYTAAKAGEYPLLLLNDGQNLFEPARAHAGVSWQVPETVDALIEDGRIEPLAIAGIDHGTTERAAEFTPTPGNRPGTGYAEKYAHFVIDELLPFLSREYGVNVRGQKVGMGGSSLGALVTLVMAVRYPGRFRRLLLMSPSVWWDNRVILTMLSQADAWERTRVWLDVGRKEGVATARDARRLRDTLRPMLSSPADLKYFEDPNGDHSETSWRRRLPHALKFLYPRGR